MRDPDKEFKMPKTKMSQNLVIASLGVLYKNRKNFRVLFRKKGDGTLRYMLVSRIMGLNFEMDIARVYSEDKNDIRAFNISSVIKIEIDMEKPQMTPEQIAEYQNI